MARPWRESDLRYRRSRLTTKVADTQMPSFSCGCVRTLIILQPSLALPEASNCRLFLYARNSKRESSGERQSRDPSGEASTRLESRAGVLVRKRGASSPIRFWYQPGDNRFSLAIATPTRRKRAVEVPTDGRPATRVAVPWISAIIGSNRVEGGGLTQIRPAFMGRSCAFLAAAWLTLADCTSKPLSRFWLRRRLCSVRARLCLTLASTFSAAFRSHRASRPRSPLRIAIISRATASLSFRSASNRLVSA